MTNDELATALERAACILQFHFPGSEAPIREAARRLREHDAARIRATEALRGVQATEDGGFTGDPVVDGIGALRAEVERLKAERTQVQECAMAMRHERDEAVTEALRARDLRKLLDDADVEVERLRAVIAQTESLVSQMRRDESNRVEQIKAHWSGEVERLRAAVQRVANERDDAQQAYDDASLGLDRCRDTLRLAVARAECMEQAWHAEVEHASRWCLRAREAESIAALAMECGLAECERERAANDDLLRRILTLMDACDARDVRLARAEAVVSAARVFHRECWTGMDLDAEKRAEQALSAALAAWDEEGKSDG